MSESKRPSLAWLHDLRLPNLARQPQGTRHTTAVHVGGYAVAPVGVRWLMLARIVWWTVSTLTLGLLIAGSLAKFAQIRTLCPTSACDNGRLSPAGMLILKRLGLSYDAFLALAGSLRQLHLTFSFYLTATTIWEITSTAVFAGVAVIICWRRSDDYIALFTSLTLIIFGVSFSNVATALPIQSPLWMLPVNIANFLGDAAFLSLLLVFPDGRFVPRWTRWIALSWVIVSIPAVIMPGSPLDLDTWPPIANLAVQTCVLGVGICAQIYRYRLVDSQDQQVQTKWIVLGAVAAIVTACGLNWAVVPILPGAKPTLGITVMYLAAATITRAAFLIIPISIGIAIVRHRLFDIDIIIKWTLVYGVLTVTLAFVYEGSSTLIEHTLLTATGQETMAAAVVVSFVFGLLFHPLRRALQSVIDRLLFRPKYVAEHRIEVFGERLRHEIDLDMASDQLAQTLDQALDQAWSIVDAHLTELHRDRHTARER